MATDKERGKSQPRNTQPRIHNDILDAIENRDTSYIPDLQVDRYPERTTLVRVGRQEIHDGKEVAVWMIPVLQGDDDHQLKLYVWDEDDKRTEADLETVEWDDDMIDYKLFTGPAAISRWPTIRLRRSNFNGWLMFIWKHLTKDNLPTTAASTKKGERTDDGATPGKKTNDTPAGKPSASKLPPSSLGIRTNTHRAYDMWQEWLTGDFSDIDEDSAVAKLQKAYTTLHGGGKELRPPIDTLRAAYKERLEIGAPSSELTQPWLQYREKRTGSDAIVRLNQKDIQRIAIDALKEARGEVTTSESPPGLSS